MSRLTKQNIDARDVLIKPHISEKSADLSATGVYTFEIDRRATKTDVMKAVKEAYGVEPRRVAVINMKPQSSRYKGIKGMKAGWRKAMIYLKEGDKIEYV